MAAMSELSKPQSSGEPSDYKRKIIIEDLTDNDQRLDLYTYLSKFGTLKSCDMPKDTDTMRRAVIVYQELKSVDNLMKKENRPHILNDHVIYIYREIRAAPNLKKLRAQRDVCTLSLCVKPPHVIPEDEFKRHFAHYGAIVGVDRAENDIKITYDDYDPVDKAIQDNPHVFDNIPYSVEKYSDSATINNSTNISGTPTPNFQEQAASEHQKSKSALVNLSNNQSNVDPPRSTGSLDGTKDLLHSDLNNRRQITSPVTVIDDRSLGNDGRLFEHAIKGMKEQANPDLPNDVPTEWNSRNLQSGEAGGQDEVRIIYYRNNPMQLAAIKIYSSEAKTKKNNKGLDDYFKERRMRAHRELVALKALQGVKNVSKLTTYTNDYTNIPDTQEDAIAGQKTYWTIMCYIDGRTLEQFMETYGTIDLLNAVKLTQKLLLTIKNIHASGVVHRDIKPSNLLVVCDKNATIETAKIHVIDFGLSYIENREDDVDWSSFEEKEKFQQTHFGATIGNAFFRVPQLNSAAWKNKTHKEQNVLLHVRRSPTIDASSVCAILFWLLTDIEPGLKHRDESNLAPHQNEEAKMKIMMKIDEAVNQIGLSPLWIADLTVIKRISKKLLPELRTQLKNYVMTTFDKGFESAEYQWTVEQLEYRLKSICHVLEQDIIPPDQHLSSITKSLLSLEPGRRLSSPYPTKLIFHKVSLAYESAKAKFVAQHSPCSWYDGHCHWLEYRQDVTERRNYDLLSYQRNKQNWMLIIVCSVHFNENGDILH
ncbi:unnamed protein product [Didymodactylos carnosus]|uniref:Protein kinase domain-containing protein n=1 Tax=Didymodactylos carnosus TaxID=1234261 RepID=A0A8S2DBH1_9BILA|nr:unnamed protein product [Didymodactylos carnosus]CAF3697568.1 unnamed protein product [Didymodactylos carnosus]